MKLMNWTVFTVLSSLQTQVHWVLALSALGLGSAILLRRKGDAVHKLLGRLWVGIMVVVSLTAVFISNNEPGELLYMAFGFSYIHLLVPFTLAMLYVGIVCARRKLFGAHKIIMVATFCGSLVVAGAFTFLPGRHMHSLFFADEAEVRMQVEQGVKK